MPPKQRPQSATPTGGADPKADKGAPGSERKERSFFGTTSSQRALRLELMGEDTPGPGAYLPASTFARAAASSSYKKSSKSGKTIVAKGSCIFASRVPQRPAPENEKVPGPGAYRKDAHTAVEKNIMNPAPSLNSRSRRLGGGSAEEENSDLKPEPGPGAYETHRFQTLQTDAAKATQMGSRQNPGFNVGSPQHQLPHEEGPAADDMKVPGPGKYETNVSELSKGSRGGGHRSAFAKPVERKKGYGMPIPHHQHGGRKGRRGSKSRPSSGHTVHV
jgi:hypothetical protein